MTSWFRSEHERRVPKAVAAPRFRRRFGRAGLQVIQPPLLPLPHYFAVLPPSRRNLPFILTSDLREHPQWLAVLRNSTLTSSGDSCRSCRQQFPRRTVQISRPLLGIPFQ